MDHIVHFKFDKQKKKKFFFFSSLFYFLFVLFIELLITKRPFQFSLSKTYYLPIAIHMLCRTAVLWRITFYKKGKKTQIRKDNDCNWCIFSFLVVRPDFDRQLTGIMQIRPWNGSLRKKTYCRSQVVSSGKIRNLEHSILSRNF